MISNLALPGYQKLSSHFGEMAMESNNFNFADARFADKKSKRFEKNH